MLAVLARHWASELSAPLDDVEQTLLAAFWRGEFPGSIGSSEDDASDIRTKVLDVISRTADHPRLVFLSTRDRISPEVVELPDGAVEVDVRLRVFWPPDADAADRDPGVAFHALAEAEFSDYSAAAESTLRMMSVRHEDFGTFCRAAGYDLPRFWFNRTAAPSTMAAQAKCRRWLQDLASKGDKPGSKARLKSDACARFLGLSGRAFERVWDEVAPESWRQSGAPKRKRLLAGREAHNPEAPR